MGSVQASVLKLLCHDCHDEFRRVRLRPRGPSCGLPLRGPDKAVLQMACYRSSPAPFRISRESFYVCARFSSFWLSNECDHPVAKFV